MLPGTLKAISEGMEALGHLGSLMMTSAAAEAVPSGEGIGEGEEELVAAAFAEMGLEPPVAGNAGPSSPPRRTGRGSQASMRSKT